MRHFCQVFRYQKDAVVNGKGVRIALTGLRLGRGAIMRSSVIPLNARKSVSRGRYRVSHFFCAHEHARDKQVDGFRLLLVERLLVWDAVALDVGNRALDSSKEVLDVLPAFAAAAYKVVEVIAPEMSCGRCFWIVTLQVFGEHPDHGSLVRHGGGRVYPIH